MDENKGSSEIERRSANSAYSRAIEDSKAALEEQQRTGWKSLSGNQKVLLRNDDTSVEYKFDFNDFIRNKSVQAGLVGIILGMIIAILAFKIPTSRTWQILICITACTFSMAGTKTIENYINEVGYREVKELNDFNRAERERKR